MRIVFDAYELLPGQGKSIGIYNYAKNLLNALAQILADDSEIVVICNTLNIADFNPTHPAISIKLIPNDASKIRRLAWLYGRAAWEIKQLKADIYFSPKGFLPLGIKMLSAKTKSAVVIHDLIPLWYKQHYPHYFGRLEELFINHAISNSVKQADLIIAISQFTAADITQRLGREKNIVTVYNGVLITEPGPRPYAQPYLFAMSSRLPHKNADGILQAYQLYRANTDKPLPLIICGISDPQQTGVIAVQGLDEPSLHAYYAYAEGFIFLSLIEGFGFPPIEALAHGTPVLCSDIEVLREIAQDQANYADLDQPALIAEKINILVNQDHTDASKEKRRQILEKYTWSSCANGILKTLKSI